ncbi:MAG TPA: tripartite tricarboxylate transporter substrate binding protein [Burkholderiales bacterium]|nr:tripartite tricarboxylate transporter substrate binding protein [Burkholderiales bacterium]
MTGRLRSAALLLLCTGAWATPAVAQQSGAAAYPTKAIRLIVPLAAGGPSDHMARALAQKLSEGIKQTVVVDNRPGASGIIGTDLVAKSLPDGYTLLLAQTALTINASLAPKLPYDTLRDLEPVSQLTAAPYLLAVHPSLPVRTIPQLIALAKARPGELNHASGGSGTGPHLAMEVLMQRAHIKVTHVTYKGGGPAMIDFIAGQTQLYMTNIVTMLPQAKAGRIRAIATSRAKRSSVAPELPTIAESGFQEYDEGAQHGVIAPAGTPKPIIDKLHAEIVKAMRSPEVLGRLTQEGAEVVASSPAEYSAQIRAEIDKWAKVVKSAGIKPE